MGMLTPRFVSLHAGLYCLVRHPVRGWGLVIGMLAPRCVSFYAGLRIASMAYLWQKTAAERLGRLRGQFARTLALSQVRVHRGGFA